MVQVLNLVVYEKKGLNPSISLISGFSLCISLFQQGMVYHVIRLCLKIIFKFCFCSVTMGIPYVQLVRQGYTTGAQLADRNWAIFGV